MPGTVVLDADDAEAVAVVQGHCPTTPLTRMALLACGFSTDYLDYWKEALGISARQS